MDVGCSALAMMDSGNGDTRCRPNLYTIIVLFDSSTKMLISLVKSAESPLAFHRIPAAFFAFLLILFNDKVTSIILVSFGKRSD